MSTTRPKLIPAFKCRLRNGTFVHVVVMSLVFSASLYYLLAVQSRKHQAQQARLCAAALVPGEGGDLSESFGRLQDQFDELVAVATLDTYGGIQRVYPDRPELREVIQNAYAAGQNPIAIRNANGRNAIQASGTVVPLSGDPSVAARRALVLIQSPGLDGGILRAIAWFVLICAVVAMAVMTKQIRWFERCVVVPLWQVTHSIGPRRRRGRIVPPLEPGDWAETSEFAARCHALLQDLADSEARARQIEHETVDELRRRQHGFDRMLRRAKDQATLDPLTKLRNRTFMEEELESLYGRARAKDADFSAMMVDVDNFKAYNDAQGHQSGDALLRFVGSLLRGGTRPTDHCIRYGGDEFLILLPDTSAEDAVEIGGRLVKLFAQYMTCLDHEHTLSLSAGVASLLVDKPQNGHDLVAKADAAMYDAKRNGKNAVACHRAA